MPDVRPWAYTAAGVATYSPGRIADKETTTSRPPKGMLEAGAKPCASSPPEEPDAMAPTVRHVTPVLPDAADGLVAEVYRQARTELGITVGPPFMMLSPVPELLAPMWALLRESL